MILSAELELSNNQALTNADAISTNVIDLGAPGTVLGAPAALTRDIGPGTPIPIMILIETAFTGSGTLTIEVQTNSTASMTGATTVARTADLGTVNLAAGTLIPITVLPNDIDGRYLALNYNLTASFSAGGVSAAIVMGVQTNEAVAGAN